jgi:hypothetical protein
LHHHEVYGFTQGGGHQDQVLLYAYLDAFYEAGFTNRIDEAIHTHRRFDLSGYRKAGEQPYVLQGRSMVVLRTRPLHEEAQHTP